MIFVDKHTVHFRRSGIFYCSFLICFSIFLNSCKQELELAPPSEYNAQDFYKTQNDFALAIAGAYGGLRGLHSYQYPIVIESLSDNISTSTNNPYARLTINDGDANVLALWSAYWTIINRTNHILDQIDAGEFTDGDLQNWIKGEALFIRGFCYFQLGWLFGGVPIVDRVMSEQELLELRRPDVAITFSFAEYNLQEAATLLPEIHTGDNLGRATRYAALGFLGRLYLFTKQYEQAREALSEIIGSGHYQLYEEFQDCFMNTLDNGSEHVFQIQYTAGLVNQGNQLVYTLVPENIRSDRFPQGGRSLWLAVSRDLYDSYEENDLRRDITIQKGYTTSSGTTDDNTLLFVKYAHGTVPSIREDNDVNLSPLRYTDIKLMYAEVLNEIQYNAAGEALEILNEVRDRAGITLFTAVDLPSQSAFREAIFQERRLEFACEFLRWFDLVRQGPEKAEDIMRAFLNRSDEGNGLYQYDDKFLLLPIPAAERQVNTNLDQNEGY